MNRSLLFIIVALLLTGIAAMGQDTSIAPSAFGVEVNAIGGKIIRHSEKFPTDVPSFSVATDVNFVWQTTGKKDWHQRRGFPVVGVGLTLTDYRSKHIFGRCAGVYPNLQVPIIRWDNWEWTCRMGVGLAYVTGKYKLTSDLDTLNTAISSHLNAFPVFATDLRYRLNSHLDLQGGLTFTHISNALFREPNLGVNMLGGHVGVRYFPRTSRPALHRSTLQPLPNRWLLDVRGAISHKVARATGDPILPAYVGAVSVSRRWKSKNKVFAGIDAAYHKDVYAFLITYGVEYGQEKQHSWDGGFFLGNEFMVGRVGILGIVGTYYRQTFLDFDPVYEKLGIKYYLRNSESGPFRELYLSAMLNTHGIVAEYSEFGLGVAF